MDSHDHEDIKFDDEIYELLIKTSVILRSHVKELTDMFETAKADWNNHSRQEIADKLTKTIPVFMSIETFLINHE